MATTIDSTNAIGARRRKSFAKCSCSEIGARATLSIMTHERALDPIGVRHLFVVARAYR